MITLLPDGVENPANLARIEDVARLFGARCAAQVAGRLVAVENAPGAREIYDRRPARDDTTLAVGNERRGLSRRILSLADETVVIPTLSRTVTTLNVAAAAAVAAWYVVRGSGAQAHVARPELRRPALLIVGEDHVEVGSTLRSAAAFGYSEVLLDDRGAGWFGGDASIRREARAAARRFKNPIHVRRATLESLALFDEIVLIAPSGPAIPLSRQRLTRGKRQLVIVGATLPEVEAIAAERVRVVTLGLEPVECAPLRLVASIALAEISRQVGRRRLKAGRPPGRAPAYERAVELSAEGDVLQVEQEDLLAY